MGLGFVKETGPGCVRNSVQVRAQADQAGARSEGDQQDQCQVHGAIGSGDHHHGVDGTEGRVMSPLQDHPNILKLFETFEDHENLYMIIE